MEAVLCDSRRERHGAEKQRKHFYPKEHNYWRQVRAVGRDAGNCGAYHGKRNSAEEVQGEDFLLFTDRRHGENEYAYR